MKSRKRRLTITRRALLQRLARRLAPEGAALVGTRGPGAGGGVVNLVDTKGGRLLAEDVDLIRLARKHGALHPWEKVAP